MEYLKQVVSYLWWEADEGRISKYTIGTWSRKVARNEIEHHGTFGDIARLLPVGCVTSQISPRGIVGESRRVQLGR
jgi:hypothetical protein